MSNTSEQLIDRRNSGLPASSSRARPPRKRPDDEVVSQLAGLVCSKFRVTIEIEAEFADGVSDQVVRTVTENSRTLRLFETD